MCVCCLETGMAVHKECLEKAKDMSGMCVKPMTPSQVKSSSL